MKPPARLLLYTWLLLMACFLSSCDLEKEDYVSKYCPGSCTVIKGRVTREDGKPLVGATVRARWSKSGYLQPKFTREKAVTTTD
ncbi:MAG: carboxypeptidase-like regulatory domain-containing protein, partial [Pontibacter sp.]|nr:carboxypeptidase-like regulatory domain-containing protein [Pontibacter sp.]